MPWYRRWFQVAVDVFKRSQELNSPYAANALTLIAFVSLFPLVLLIISVIGLLTGSNPHLADDVVHNLGLTGDSAKIVRDTLQSAKETGGLGSVVAVIGMAWSGLSLVGALRYVVNLPRGVVVKGLKARMIGVPWLAGAALILAVSVALSAVVNWLPGWADPLAVIVAFAVDIVLFGWTFWFLDTRRPAMRTILPGAVAAAVGFEVLKLVGAVAVPQLIASSSATYGALGAVFAILTWLLVFGRLVVFSVVLSDVLEHAAPDQPESSDADEHTQ